MLIGHTNERLDEEEIFRMMGNPIAMTLVFYINYIWLVPRLVFNKKNKIYVLLNVILCAGMLFFTHFWFRLGNVYFHIPLPPPPNDSLWMWTFLSFRIRDFILFGLIAAVAATIRMSKNGTKLN